MKEFRASIITWDPSEDETYLPGSVIKKNANGITFKNELMSPGKTIVKWFSQVNYQAYRAIPKLPLLVADQKYRLQLEADVPAKKVYVKLTFLNRFGEIIATEFIKTATEIFVVPAKTYEYQLELINAGVTEFTFKRLVLLRAEDEVCENYLFTEIKPSKREMAVFFAEPSLHGLFRPELDAKGFLVSSLDEYQNFDQNVALQQRLTALNEQVERLVFVGSGPISSLVATYYSAKFARGLWVPDATKVDLEKLADLTQTAPDLAMLKQKLTTAKSYHKFVGVRDAFLEKLYEQNVVYDFLRVK